MDQIIGWWSAGITSAVAIKTGLEQGLNVIPIYFETGSAHPDNARFKADCEKWYGRPILTLQSAKYKSVMDVIEKRRYINGPAGALCTAELKKELRFAVEKIMPYTAQIFGFEFQPKEIKRAERFTEQYPEAKAVFPLIEAQITKAMCLHKIATVGIEKPEMYKLGYHNNNCIGCVKGGMGYWNKIRKDFPDVFAEMSKAEDKLGRTCLKGISLKDLDPARGSYPEEIQPECGVYCEIETFE